MKVSIIFSGVLLLKEDSVAPRLQFSSWNSDLVIVRHSSGSMGWRSHACVASFRGLMAWAILTRW